MVMKLKIITKRAFFCSRMEGYTELKENILQKFRLAFYLTQLSIGA